MTQNTTEEFMNIKFKVMKISLVIVGMLFILSVSSCTTSRVVYQPQKVVVAKKAAKYKVVHVKGKKYYVWNGRYHKKTKRGYMVVRL